MPFKKRKEAKAREADVHAHEELVFEALMKVAGQKTDPAEKALALKGIEIMITQQIAAENSAISEKVRNKKDNVELVGVPVVIGGVVLLCLTGPIVLAGAPLILGGAFGSKVLASKRSKAVKKKLEEASGSHMDCMKNQAARAAAMADAAVEQNVEAVSKSPLYQKVLATPGLAETFAEAMAKHIATPKEDPAADAAPKKLRIIRHPGNDLK